MGPQAFDTLTRLMVRSSAISSYNVIARHVTLSSSAKFREGDGHIALLATAH